MHCKFDCITVAFDRTLTCNLYQLLWITLFMTCSIISHIVVTGFYMKSVQICQLLLESIGEQSNKIIQNHKMYFMDDLLPLWFPQKIALLYDRHLTQEVVQAQIGLQLLSTAQMSRIASWTTSRRIRGQPRTGHYNQVKSKHEQIFPLASRILEKRTVFVLFEYNVFWKSLNTPKYAYLDVLWNIKYVRSYFVIFSKNMKYAIVFVLMNASKYTYVCCHRINRRISPYLVKSKSIKEFITFELSMLVVDKNKQWITLTCILLSFCFELTLTHDFTQEGVLILEGMLHPGCTVGQDNIGN